MALTTNEITDFASRLHSHVISLATERDTQAEELAKVYETVRILKSEMADVKADAENKIKVANRIHDEQATLQAKLDEARQQLVDIARIAEEWAKAKDKIIESAAVYNLMTKIREAVKTP